MSALRACRRTADPDFCAAAARASPAAWPHTMPCTRRRRQSRHVYCRGLRIAHIAAAARLDTDGLAAATHALHSHRGAHRPGKNHPRLVAVGQHLVVIHQHPTPS